MTIVLAVLLVLMLAAVFMSGFFFGVLYCIHDILEKLEDKKP